MDEKQIQFLYDNYAKNKGFKDYGEFRDLMNNEANRKIFFDESNHELGFKDYNDFNGVIGVKKKDGGSDLSQDQPPSTPSAKDFLVDTRSSSNPQYGFKNGQWTMPQSFSEDPRILDFLVNANKPKQQPHVGAVGDPVKNILTPVRQQYDKANKLHAGINQNEQLHSESTLVNTEGGIAKQRQLNTQAVQSKDDLHEAANRYTGALTFVNGMFSNGKEAGDYLNNVAKDNGGKLPDDNETINLAQQKFNDYKSVEDDVVNKYGSIRMAALAEEKKNNPLFADQMNAIAADNNGNPVTPDIREGNIVRQYIAEHGKDLDALAEQHPDQKDDWDNLKNNFINLYPTTSAFMIGNEVSRAREAAGMNNGIYNPHTNNFDKETDAIAEQLFKNDPQKLNLYRTEVALNKSKYIDTPGFVEKGINRIGQFIQGVGNIPNDISASTGLVDPDVSTGILGEMRKQDELVTSDPKGWHYFTATAGDFSGLIASMAAGGSALKALGLNPLVADKVMTGLTFYDSELKNALMKYPNSQLKATTVAGLNTTLYGVLGNIFPAAKLQQVFEKAKPEMENAIKYLDNTAISAEAARNKLNETFTNIIHQYATGASEMVALNQFNQGLDKMMGIKGAAYDTLHPEGETADVVKSMAAGNLLPSIVIGASAVRKSTIKDNIWEMANNPKRFDNVLSDLRDSHPEQATEIQQRLANLSFIAKTKADLDENTSLSDAQKKNYLLQAVNERNLSQKAAQVEEPKLNETLNKDILSSQSIKQDILNGQEGTDVLPQEKRVSVQMPNEVSKPNVVDNIPQAEMPETKDTKNGAKVVLPQANRKPDVVTDVERVPKEEYDAFVDKNDVSYERLNDIASKVKNQQPLSEREIAIFHGKTSEINDIISQSEKKPSISVTQSRKPDVVELKKSVDEPQVESVDNNEQPQVTNGGFSERLEKNIKDTTQRANDNKEAQRKADVLISGVHPELKDFAEKYNGWILGKAEKPEINTAEEGKIGKILRLVYSDMSDADMKNQLKQYAKAYDFYGSSLPSKTTQIGNDFGSFKDHILEQITNVKNKDFDYGIQTSLDRKTTEQALRNLREGKDTKAAQALTADIQKMYDDGHVALHRGRGGNYEALEIPIEDYFKTVNKEAKDFKETDLDALNTELGEDAFNHTFDTEYDYILKGEYNSGNGSDRQSLLQAVKDARNKYWEAHEALTKKYDTAYIGKHATVEEVNHLKELSQRIVDADSVAKEAYPKEDWAKTRSEFEKEVNSNTFAVVEGRGKSGHAKGGKERLLLTDKKEGEIIIPDDNNVQRLRQKIKESSQEELSHDELTKAVTSLLTLVKKGFDNGSDVYTAELPNGTKLTFAKNITNLKSVDHPDFNYRRVIKDAIANGDYKDAIENGSMTFDEVKTIIESAGLEVPKELESVKINNDNETKRSGSTNETPTATTGEKTTTPATIGSEESPTQSDKKIPGEEPKPEPTKPTEPKPTANPTGKSEPNEPSKVNEKPSKFTEKLRSLADKIEKGEVEGFGKGMEGVQKQGAGFDFNKAIADAIRFVADAIDTGKDVAKSIEEGWEKVRKHFEENNAKFKDEAALKQKFADLFKESEEKKPEDELTKISNAINEAFIEGKFGTAALDKILGQLQDTDTRKLYDTVKKRIESGTLKTDDVRDRVLTTKSGSEADQAALLYDMAELKGKEASITKEIVEEADADKQKQLQQKLLDVQNKMMDNALANKAIGRSASNMFRIRQLIANRDLSLVDMQEQYKASNRLKELTPEQSDKVRIAYNKIRELQQKAKDREAEYTEAIKKRKEAEDLLKKSQTQNEILKEQGTKLKQLTQEAKAIKKASRAKNAKDAIQKSQDRIDEAKKNLRNLGGGQLSSGVDPRMAVEISKIAAEKVYQGAVKFHELVANVLDEVKDVFPHWTDKDVVAHLFPNIKDADKLFNSKQGYELADKDVKEKYKALQNANKQFALERFKWERDMRTEIMKEKPFMERAVDGILRWQRFAVLSYPSTIVKLFAVVTHQLLLKPLKFATQSLVYNTIGRIPQIVGKENLFKNAAIWGNPSIKALAEYYGAFIRNFSLANLKEQFSGIDDKEIMYGRGMTYEEWAANKGIMEMPGRAHGYIKSFIKKPEFEFAHNQLIGWHLNKMQQIDKQLKAGDLTVEKKAELEEQYKQYDITNPDNLELINKLSLEHSKWAIMMNDNKVVEAFRRLTDTKDATSTAGILGKALLKSELPVVKIPTNWVGRAFAYKYGLLQSFFPKVSKMPDGSKEVLRPSIFSVMLKGGDALTPQQAELMGKCLTLGTMGAAIFALGYMNRKNVTQNEDGSYELFGMHFPKIFIHSPELESFFSGAETANLHNNDKGHNKGFIESWIRSDIDIASKNPFWTMLQYGAIPNAITIMLSKKNEDKKIDLVQNVINKKITDMIVPGFVKQPAQWADTEKGFDVKGDAIKRKPQGSEIERLWQYLEMGLPLLRENVPEQEIRTRTVKDTQAFTKRQMTKKEYTDFTKQSEDSYQEEFKNYIGGSKDVSFNNYGDPIIPTEKNPERSSKPYSELTEAEKKLFSSKLKKHVSSIVLKGMNLQDIDEE